MDFLGETIDKLTLLELRPRNFPTVGLIDKLYSYRRRELDRPQSLLAAERLQETISPGDSAIILTGFAVPPTITIGETDGPIGAASLARSINFGLRGKALLLADDYQIEMLQSTCQAAELRVVNFERTQTVPQSTAIRPFPHSNIKESEETAERILDEVSPAAVISVERAGRNQSDIYHTAFGHDMSEWTAKIDIILDKARERGILTIGIGDWGNEAGLGSLKDKIREIMPGGAKCKCPCGNGIATIVEAEIPIIVTCSNLGAYGITACLSAILGNRKLLQSPEVEENMIRECLLSGGMEATQAKPSLSFPVDAIPKDAYIGVLKLMHSAVAQGATKIPLYRERTE